MQLQIEKKKLGQILIKCKEDPPAIWTNSITILYLWLWARGPHSHTSHSHESLARKCHCKSCQHGNDLFYKWQGTWKMWGTERVKYLSERRFWKLSKREEQLPNICYLSLWVQSCTKERKSSYPLHNKLVNDASNESSYGPESWPKKSFESLQ
jgi:hypothetical protein